MNSPLSGRVNPYPGLTPFEEKDARYFFGRDREVDEILDRMAARRLLAVIGVSGCGKSSLVRAGVLPVLRRGLASGLPARWSICTMTPGNDPGGSLRTALAAAPGWPRTSFDLIDHARSRLDPQENLLLIVDQFEELFRFRAITMEQDAGNAAALFVNLLLNAVDQREVPIYVLLTMRTDALGDCAQFRGLPEALNDCYYLVPRMTRLQQQEAIELPLGGQGAVIHPGLVQRLLNDSAEDPDNLPVLQHLLKRLWENWSARGIDQTIGSQDYDEVGGWRNAIGNDAESVFGQFAAEEEGIRRVFQWITERGAGEKAVRRPRTLPECVEISGLGWELLGRIVCAFQARGLLRPSDGTEQSLVDLPHESLMWHWPRLRKWIAEEAERAAQLRFLQQSARQRILLTGLALRSALKLRAELRSQPKSGERYLKAAELEQTGNWIDQSEQSEGRGRRHTSLGATPDSEGVNFSLFSENATSVELLLFQSHDSPLPFQVIRLDPDRNRTFYFWHIHVPGLRAGTHYAYRIDGPWNPAAGLRFDRNKVLVDPYSRGNTKTVWNRARAHGLEDNVAASMRCVVVDTSGYDWEADRPLETPNADLVIYEMHVRGYTRSPSSGVDRPGTFAGVIEKIPYLTRLGITAVQLLPVCDFDESDSRGMVNGELLTNYWGYSSFGFFAPQSLFCVNPELGLHFDEFRDMVKALHRAGIAVILSLSFSHTDEGNHLGPTFCFKGIDNGTYYSLFTSDRQYYLDFTGYGNSINPDHAITQKLVLDSMRYWVREGHVDGFMFDKESVLPGGEQSVGSQFSSVIWRLETDESLEETRRIAEVWDPADISHFPGDRWMEWNGRFRDDIRSFVKGDPGRVGAVANRIAGSPDLYQNTGKLPTNGVNFATCHDGFTLYDLVSYNVKHNEANGENNLDGTSDNISWNCGVEGDTADPEVNALRMRQMKNFATILMLSRGVPMITAGDEVARTQKGNNNAFCQDNEISWFDWSLVDRNAGLLRFWELIIRFRKEHVVLREPEFPGGATNERSMPEVAWHGCRLGAPGWNDPDARALAFTFAGRKGGSDLHVMMNMWRESLPFEVPALVGRGWFQAMNTAASVPRDICDPGSEPPFFGSICSVMPRSIVVLVSK